uniref:Uncharacterized protein n=1 Tax=Steinernema glaseri TaxID=37863 RepID=A0A1I7XYA2_9BILA
MECFWQSCYHKKKPAYKSEDDWTIWKMRYTQNKLLTAVLGKSLITAIEPVAISTKLKVKKNQKITLAFESNLKISNKTDFQDSNTNDDRLSELRGGSGGN